MSKLFVWTPKRPRDEAFFDAALGDGRGGRLEIWAGMSLPKDQAIYLLRPRRGSMGALLHTIAHDLIVSASIRALLERFSLPSTSFHPVFVYQKRSENVVARYHWANVACEAPLLDRRHSEFELSVTGKVFRRISRFVVNPQAVPAEDLFLCQETSQHVFSAPLTRAVINAGVPDSFFIPIEESRWGIGWS